MGEHDGAADRQAQARAAVVAVARAFCAVQAVKDAGQLVRGHAGRAVVQLHLQLRDSIGRWQQACRNAQQAARVGVAQAVFQQVQKHLVQLLCIAAHQGGRLGGAWCGQGVQAAGVHINARLRQTRAHGRQRLGQQRQRVHRYLGRGRVGARCIQAGAQVAHQLDQAHHLPVQAQRGLVVKGADAVLHGLDLGAHGGQGRAQLVGHVAQPLAAAGLDAAQLFGHGVEGAGELGQFVVAVHGHAGVQVALRNAARAGGQGLDRGQPAPCEPARQRSARARPARPVHATKPRCWARKAWSASLRTPWGGASTRWPMTWPLAPRNARRAPPGWGAVPATS